MNDLLMNHPAVGQPVKHTDNPSHTGTARNPIGTLAWARRTGGRLSSQERQFMQRQLVESQAQAMAQQNGRVRDVVRHLDLDAIPIPDSALAKKAEQYAAELSPESLLNHCCRTYLWGSLLAQCDKTKLNDPELLYVASLLHDLGATDHHFGHDERAHCFAVEGGFAAEAFLLEEGLDPDKTERVAEAIILHINPLVEAEYGAMARYLSAGAWFDMQSYRVSDIPVDTARRVLASYPGLDIVPLFSQFVLREVALRPHSRAAATVETMGGDIPVLYHWAEVERDLSREPY
jgi:cyanamide hydratase family protein with HD domain